MDFPLHSFRTVSDVVPTQMGFVDPTSGLDHRIDGLTDKLHVVDS